MSSSIFTVLLEIVCKSAYPLQSLPATDLPLLWVLLANSGSVFTEQFCSIVGNAAATGITYFTMYRNCLVLSYHDDSPSYIQCRGKRTWKSLLIGLSFGVYRWPHYFFVTQYWRLKLAMFRPALHLVLRAFTRCIAEWEDHLHSAPAARPPGGKISVNGLNFVS